MYSEGQKNPRLPSSSEQKINFSTGTIAVLAGVLILGVGIGSAITSTTDGGQGNIASQQQLDMAVPDPEFCRQWGASAFVIDVEMYTTLNPSTSFVTQPALQPGCVIRRENWTVLQKQGAISNEDVQLKENISWLPDLGLTWSVGADGMSMPLILLTSFITALAVLAAWPVKFKPKLFFFLILVMDGGQIAVFAVQDMLLFFLTWELELIPVYLLLLYGVVKIDNMQQQNSLFIQLAVLSSFF